MTDTHTESVWPEERYIYSLDEVVELSGLPQAELVQLVECGALAPTGEEISQWSFDIHCLTVARTARRLRDAFELDVSGMGLALTLLDRIRALEAEIADLRARLPGALLR